MRKYNTRFLDLMDQGVFDTNKLAQDLLDWMTDEDIHQFAQQNDYTQVLEEPVEKFDILDLEVPNFIFQDEDGDSYNFNIVESFLNEGEDCTGPVLCISFDWKDKECSLCFVSFNNTKDIIKFSFEDFSDIQFGIKTLSDDILNQWKKYYEEQNGKKEN